ncbi:hypothetical protein [Streptomyces broussonetiae]|uniref:Uncharacterized protein n=1 Tax=Streptomyces broussonetiae TaxID=2686304 RepID=A0A6I6N8R2_9ACTN|nr:hypothetical protein [Streptomyces broussonetiae]QHA07904.1 hypothetical protein GQF42_35600 [Streptomyces broussonetiae]
MDSEMAALAASGATTLVSLMVTDSWMHARELVARYFSRIGTDETSITNLDTTRTRLLAAEARGDAQTTRDITTEWDAYLRHLLQSGSATGDDLRELLACLPDVTNSVEAQASTVHNTISGGVQHGPVIQSGRIARITVHTHRPTDPA